MHSIARKELGDRARVVELVRLNSDTFPTLSTKRDYIERGWKLLLPPRDIRLTNHDLARLKGHLHEVYPDYLVISVTQDLEQRTHMYITPDSQFKKGSESLQLSDFKPGDCVSAAVRHQDSLPNAIVILEVLD